MVRSVKEVLDSEQTGSEEQPDGGVGEKLQRPKPPPQPPCEFEHGERSCGRRDCGRLSCGQWRVGCPGDEQGGERNGRPLGERPFVEQGVEEPGGRPSTFGGGATPEALSEPV